MTERQIIKQQMMEEIAECKVKERLLSSDIITAKPIVDIQGADLLAIMRVKDGAKFARIQCKGRTLLRPQSKCYIKIKESYITGTFTCLLYLDCRYDNSEHLFCFFTNIIRNRKDLWKLKDGSYILNLYGKTFKEKCSAFYVNDFFIERIKEMIEASDPGKEFHHQWATFNVRFPAVDGSFSQK